MNRLLLSLVCVLFLLGGSVGCSDHLPPNLTPQAQQAWYVNKVIKALDVVMDVAIAGNATDPPQISTSDTRVIVEWHQDAIKVAHAAVGNWRDAVDLSLDDALKHLSAKTRSQVLPYAELVRVLLKEVR